MRRIYFPIPFTRRVPENGRHFSIVAWRKVFALHTIKGGVYFGVFGEHLDDAGTDWRSGAGYHSITVTPFEWKFGEDHGYYDGPHCSFAVGPVKFNWQHNWCKKCMPDD